MGGGDLGREGGLDGCDFDAAEYDAAAKAWRDTVCCFRELGAGKRLGPSTKDERRRAAAWCSTVPDHACRE